MKFKLIIFFSMIIKLMASKGLVDEKNVTGTIYQSVELPCFIEDGHKYIWMKSDRTEIISIGELIMTNDSRFSIEKTCNKNVNNSNGQSGCWVFLKLNQLSLADEGTFVCQKDTMKTSYLFLNILVPPFLNNETEGQMKKNLNIVEGNDVELECSASGKPMPEIKWFALTNNKIHGTYIKSGVILDLKNISRDSIKQYECVAENGVNPSISKIFTLNVEFPPSIVYFEIDKSKFKSYNDEKNPNAEIKIVSKYTGNPKPTFKWSLNGIELDYITELNNFTFNFTELEDSKIFFSILKLKNFKNNQKNILVEFKIENRIGMANSSFFLNVSEIKNSKINTKLPKKLPYFFPSLYDEKEKKNNIEKKRTILSELEDKTVYIIDQPEGVKIKKGEGCNEALQGLWACTLCLMCINNLCFCIQWFS
ncbi:unnamed protein product [Brachionus calyciflorus]|uniref:Ig-like domain-containing protein n=1 Tax=Brachionus calyciflorus TaxID=104777 RepID=A0A813M2X1_9BILA|nr:unnamed protein product [Brachionus calyciflorus]